MRSVVIALLAWSTAGCTTGFDCLADSECGDNQVCNAGTCKTGTRGVSNSNGDSPRTGDDGLPTVDTAPPIVVINHPRPYELISGMMLIEAAVIDDVAVDVENVTAVIKDSFEVPLLPIEGASRYVANFDSALLGNAAFPSVVVTAYDLARNKGKAGLEFALDTTPPILSFTSPTQQFYQLGDESGLVECSTVINPLGAQRVTHGSVIDINYTFGNSFYPRLRIEDQGNGQFRNVPIPVSGTDASTAKLFLLDKTGIAAGHKLLINDGSGACMINPAIIPNPDAPRPDQAIVQALAPAGPTGQPLFNNTGPVTPPCLILGGQGEEVEYPEPVCGNAEPDLTIWNGYLVSVDGTEFGVSPAVWVLNDFDEENIFICSGGVFDIGNFSADGEVCLAASATDNLGYTGVSQPIGICVDRTSSGACIGFDASVNAASMCSDGCAAASNPKRPPDFGTAHEMIYWE